MDVLSIIGLLLAVVAVLLGAILKGAGLHALVSAAAFMIVVVGTIAAICVQTPMQVMRRALSMFPWILRPPVHAPALMIKKIIDWSYIARRQGLLGLESRIEDEPDPFLRKGLQMVVDGSEPDIIRSTTGVRYCMPAKRPISAQQRYSRAWGSIHRRWASSVRYWA